MQIVSANDLKDDSEFAEIVEDMREECGKYGKYMVGASSHALLISEHVTFIVYYHNPCLFSSLVVVARILLQRGVVSSNRISELDFECTAIISS